MIKYVLFGFLFVAAGVSAQAEPQHALTLFGEPKYTRDFTHFDYVNPNAPKGGELRLSHPIAYDSLNPFILKGVAAPGISLSLQPLMTNALDEPQTLYGVIAQSVEVAKNKRSITFTLRQDARWHDGKPLTAADVAFTLETLKEKGHPQYRIIYAAVERVEILSDHRIRFHMKESTNRELPIALASMYVLPKHFYDTHDFEKTTLTPILGSGPYKIHDVDQGRSITYERVKDFWAKDLPVYSGQNNFDEISYTIFRDETVAVEGIKSQRYDFREEYIARNWATAYDIPAIKSGELKKVKIPHKLPRGMQAFLFNTRLDKFSDVRVREAIGLTMDFEWMNRVLFYGAYEHSASFFQNSPFMASGIPQGDELALLEPFRSELPEHVFNMPFKMPESDGSGHARAMLIKAQALLNDAGWVMREGKRVHETTGEVLSVEFMMRQRTFERVVGMMRRNLARLGIDSSFRYVDDSQYQKRVNSNDFDVISVWWNNGLIFPGNEQRGYWHSSQANIEGSLNYSGLQNPVIDALVEQLDKAETLEDLTAAAHALDRVLLSKHLVVPHWHLSAWRVLYWNHLAHPENLPPYGLALETWWHKEAAQEAVQ